MINSKKNKSKWSDREVEYLKKNWNMPIKVLAKTLNRTESSVSSKKYDMRDLPGKEKDVCDDKRDEKSKDVQSQRIKIKVIDALKQAAANDKSSYLLVRDGKSIDFLINGEEDLKKLEKAGDLKIGDEVFEIKRKYVIGLKMT